MHDVYTSCMYVLMHTYMTLYVFCVKIITYVRTYMHTSCEILYLTNVKYLRTYVNISLLYIEILIQ